MKDTYKTLAIALGVCLAVAGIIDYILIKLGVNATFSNGFAIAILGVFPKLRETLEKISDEQKVPEEAPAFPKVRTLQQRTLNSIVAVAQVTATGFAAIGFAAIFAAAACMAADVSADKILIVQAPLTLATALTFCYFAGRWLGYRSSRPYLSAFVCAMLIRVPLGVLDFFTLSSADFFTLYGREKTVNLELAMTGGGVGAFAAILALGVFIGRKRRLVQYFQYLLRQIPMESRRILVDLAYDEACRIKNQDK